MKGIGEKARREAELLRTAQVEQGNAAGMAAWAELNSDHGYASLGGSVDDEWFETRLEDAHHRSLTESNSEQTVFVSNPRPSESTKGGTDVDVTVVFGPDYEERGEVTLVPRAYDGMPAAWGDRSNWVSGALLQELEGQYPLGREIKDVLDGIEATAARVIPKSYDGHRWVVEAEYLKS